MGSLPGWCGCRAGCFNTNVVGCAAFAGISGSSTATTLTIGRVTYTQLKQRGYDERLAVGSLAGAGTLGLLIPPSIIPIIYASVVGESVGQLFLAGVFPGLLVAGLFSMWIVFRAKLTPEVVPPIAEPYTWRDRGKGTHPHVPGFGAHDSHPGEHLQRHCHPDRSGGARRRRGGLSRSRGRGA